MLPERKHEITRLEAFSDAVFAFALTLLVVSQDVPRDDDQLMVLPNGFLPFACCFAILVLSAGVGVLACVAALVLPVQFSFLSPMCFGLMGPLHWAYGTRRDRQRRAFEQALLREAAVTA